ncbi:MAG: adenosylcobinamide-GDP ribazoletransferase [Bacteroidales bacterium]|nr:adenosylcobinamide-GDP ribazoletransferase [Bacteroidales bacterium]
MNILATFIFFTRIPFWRIREVPASCFKHVVPYWPLIGMLTGSTMALVFLMTRFFFPIGISILFAIIARLLLTGCLHEDGLADCLDAFGGGTNKERILAIMKDSHIGSYGVIGLICYFLFFYVCSINLPARHLPLFFIIGDVWGKFTASHIINLLPYARKEEESKAHNVYSRMSCIELIFNITIALITTISLILLLGTTYIPALILPIMTFLFFVKYLQKRIQGYTGDCCGFAFLASELTFQITAVFCSYNL